MGEAIMASVGRSGVLPGPKWKLQTRIYTSNGQFTVPGNIKNNEIKVICYGGGGGACNDGSYYWTWGWTAGGGGGGGFMTMKTFTNINSLEIININIGPGGTGGSIGGTGGTTFFGKYLSAIGGYGAQGRASQYRDGQMKGGSGGSGGGGGYGGGYANGGDGMQFGGGGSSLYAVSNYLGPSAAYKEYFTGKRLIYNNELYGAGGNGGRYGGGGGCGGIRVEVNGYANENYSSDGSSYFNNQLYSIGGRGGCIYDNEYNIYSKIIGYSGLGGNGGSYTKEPENGSKIIDKNDNDLIDNNINFINLGHKGSIDSQLYSGIGGYGGGGGYGGCGGKGGGSISHNLSTHDGISSYNAILFGSGGGGGGYGANGGNGYKPGQSEDFPSGGGGGGGYGGKGADADNKSGGGGGGYGPSNYGAGGGGTAINGSNGKSGVCIIQYYEMVME